MYNKNPYKNERLSLGLQVNLEKIKFVVFDHSYILWEGSVFCEGLQLLGAADLLATG